MIDTEGYRANVGIILCNRNGKLFWARRIGEDAWQFPQGGIRESESLEDALFRELSEEVGLSHEDVEIIGSTNEWLRYKIPKKWVRRRGEQPLCIGQKQRWFLLLLTGNENKVCLDASEKPEFDTWRWVSHREPVEQVIAFKRKVYSKALSELLPLLNAKDF